MYPFNQNPYFINQRGYSTVPFNDCYRNYSNPWLRPVIYNPSFAQNPYSVPDSFKYPDIEDTTKPNDGFRVSKLDVREVKTCRDLNVILGQIDYIITVFCDEIKFIGNNLGYECDDTFDVHTVSKNDVVLVGKYSAIILNAMLVREHICNSDINSIDMSEYHDIINEYNDIASKF